MWGGFNLSHNRWLPYQRLKSLYQLGVESGSANSLFLAPVARVENLIRFAKKSTCNHVSRSTLSTRYSRIPLLYLIKRGAYTNYSCTKMLLQKNFPWAGVSQFFCFSNKTACNQRVIILSETISIWLSIDLNLSNAQFKIWIDQQQSTVMTLSISNKNWIESQFNRNDHMT